MRGPERGRVRKIDTHDFRVATRATTRDVNRQIVLNLIREHQPISRAELARQMHVPRGALTALVRELVADGAIYEQGRAVAMRGPGRRPTMLCLRTSGRVVVAIDVRPSRITVALADVTGRMFASHGFDTPADPAALPDALATRVEALLAAHGGAAGDGARAVTAGCDGIGLVVPGMVDRQAGRIIYAPRLGWRDVDLRAPLAARLGVPVYVESAPHACALARLWLSPDATSGVKSFAYVSVSDGLGVGFVMNGEALRGDAHTAGEFGHVSLDRDGPPCACGRHGCWEAYACNSATVLRYVERRPAGPGEGEFSDGLPSIEEVVRRAKRGEPAAVEALVETAEYIGRGLATVVSAFNPGRIYVGGEVTAAWELLETPIRRVLARETLTAATRLTPVIPDGDPRAYRLLGAVALVTAPRFAAPAVA